MLSYYYSFICVCSKRIVFSNLKLIAKQKPGIYYYFYFLPATFTKINMCDSKILTDSVEVKT